ncbi:Protein kinase-like domain containing protein [Parasponia andersonii]|uniref:Protein kinase-like domain containing protein n=1 Tax=Parasponia andersonii TaxID=3476 RepID=A0A2P5ASI3_PARAD|nr:Protein kinase-like domain containing protein [Parasponia andersonii]
MCVEQSRQGDVYSCGIVLLEMFTRRRPTNEMFNNFVQMALSERLVHIMDSSLLSREVEEITTRSKDGRRYNNNGRTEIYSEKGNINYENPNQRSVHMQNCLVSVLKIGLTCSEESLKERMNMGDVIRELQHIRYANLDVGIQNQKQRTSLKTCTTT